MTPTSGAGACTRCSAGRGANTEDNSCDPCPPAFYGALGRCFPCLDGYTQPDEGQPNCDKPPLNLTYLPPSRPLREPIYLSLTI